MVNYSGKIIRADVPVSEQVISEIIQDLPKTSVAMARMRHVPMSKAKTRQPVLSSLPLAYWVNGDDGLKQTTNMAWKSVYMTAEEIATLVPIPNALVDDSDIPLWPEVRARVAEAFALKIDQAILFGAEKPATWPADVVSGATAAGNTVTAGTGKDLGVDVAKLAGLVSTEGFAVNGFASAPGLNWELISLRDANGQPVYHTPISEGQPSTLYGYPLSEVTNGAWDPAKATLIAADWSKFAIGIRQDLSFDLFDQMIVSDDSGKVVFNSAQQDSRILRAVMRIGYAVANPLTRLQPDESKRFPAGIVTPQAATKPASS